MVNSLQDAIDMILARKKGSVLTGYIDGQAGHIAGIIKHKNKNYVIFMIRRWFETFGYIMKFGYNIEGICIPTHALERATNLFSDILIVKSPEDLVYTIEAVRFYDYVKNNKTIRYNPFSRVQESGISCDMLEISNE